MAYLKALEKLRLVALAAALLVVPALTGLAAAKPNQDPAWKLVEAAWKGDLDSTKDLLAKGADANAAHASGLTPLHAAKLGGRKDIETLLLEKGAKADAVVPSPAQLADALLSQFIPNTGPGVAVLVAKDGAILLEKGYGLASLPETRPITPETQFRIGSVTKQFTASAILRLQEEGKLQTTDPLSKYYPDFPRGADITLHHLLTHTSGVHSYTAQPDFLPRVGTPISPDALLTEIKTYPLDFEPGQRWSYSNSGYFILGQIVEKVSGQELGDYLTKTFFGPLGMKSTGVHRPEMKVAPHALGYGRDQERFTPALDWDMSWAGGAGAVYSTVRDMYLWNEAVFKGQALQPKSLKAAFTVGTTKEAPATDQKRGYGYGWSMTVFRGTEEISHGGGLHGFASFLLRLPEHNLTVVVLSNVTGLREAEPGNLSHRLAEMFLVGQLAPQTPPPPKPVATKVSTEALDAIVGRYDYGMAVLVVRREGERVLAKMPMQPEFEIFPRSETEFFWKVVNAEVTFEKDASGNVTKAIHRQGGHTVHAPKLKPLTDAKVEPAVLDALIGEYEFGKQGTLKITRDGTELFAQLTGQPRFRLSATSADEWELVEVNAQLRVVRDAEGNVIKLVNHQRGQQIDAPKKK
jgi:CubicO group peptidase (beta-lactamase class C family)